MQRLTADMGFTCQRRQSAVCLNHQTQGIQKHIDVIVLFKLLQGEFHCIASVFYEHRIQGQIADHSNESHWKAGEVPLGDDCILVLDAESIRISKK